MKRVFALILPAALAVSACGGAGTGPTPLTSLEAAQKGLDGIVNADLGEAATADMPVAGTANYVGSFGVGSAADPSDFVVGEATVEADFAAATMVGDVDNFIAGTMDPGGTVILASDIDGALILTGSFVDAQGVLAVEGDIMGFATSGGLLTEFKGDNAETLLGLGAGDMDGTAVEMYLVVEQ